jgi:pimeloyl-ACP methyl ester carboxylesterase
MFLPLQWAAFPGVHEHQQGAIPSPPFVMIANVPCIELRPSGVTISEAASRPLVLFLHGNSSDLLRNWRKCRELANRTGFRVVCPEYRGYGVYPGPSKPELIVADVRRVLRASMGPHHRAHVVGYSIGAAVACEVAGRESDLVASLTLAAPFRSLRAMVQQTTKSAALAKALTPSGTPFDSAAWMRQLPNRMPVLVVQGSRDALIPYSQGFSLASEHPGSLFILQVGRTHTSVDFGPIYSHLLSLR